MIAFPKGFVWGAACSSYQTEGAWEKDGKGLSIWDDFSHIPGMITNGETGDIACDSYHRYHEDIRLLKELGIPAYRFSISWPRILPDGTGNINEKGLAYYDAMIDLLLENGIEPYVTLFHWDLPSALQNKGGWRNRKTAEAFYDYASVIAKHFDGRVRNYITINEPQCFIELGYSRGTHAPGLQLSEDTISACIHNALLAHGFAVQALRKASNIPLNIGIASTGRLAYSDKDTPEACKAATEASFKLTEEDWYFTHHLYLDPIVLGHYPKDAPAFIQRYAATVPDADWDIIKKSIDFIGLNVYHGFPFEKAGIYTGFPRTATKWPVTPEVMRYGPRWLFERYALPICITENGQSCNDRIFLDGCVHDPDRIDFLSRYLKELNKAIEDGTPVSGYFHWSLTDNFEWNFGYDERFGLVYIDYPTSNRIPKDSAYWYAKTIKANGANL